MKVTHKEGNVQSDSKQQWDSDMNGEDIEANVQESTKKQGKH